MGAAGETRPAPRDLARFADSYPRAGCRPDVSASLRLVYERVRRLLLQVETRRQVAGLSQAEAARLVGISPRSWRALLNGETWPDVDTFVLLNDVFEVRRLQPTHDRLDVPPEQPALWADPDDPPPARGRHGLLDQLAHLVGHPAPQVLALLGVDAPVDPDEIEQALIDVACEDYLPRKHTWIYRACARCEFARRLANDTCDRHGGWTPDDSWWDQLEAAWRTDRLNRGRRTTHGETRLKVLRDVVRQVKQLDVAAAALP